MASGRIRMTFDSLILHMNATFSYPLDHWAFLYGKPENGGVIRQFPEDFQVVENLGFAPSGEGRHWWFEIEKTEANTVDIANLIGRIASVHRKEVGFSGQKDRNAVTSQWFSVLAEKTPVETLQAIRTECDNDPRLRLLQYERHTAKLKTGSHRTNRFVIRVRALTGEKPVIESRLEQIAKNGVPNYFGEQRFGRNGKNMQTVARWFSGEKLKLDRQARSMALSSARSWLFNELLSQRIQLGNWATPLIGDVMMLDGSRSWFTHDGSDLTIVDRIRQHDIHISGPLWGGGENPAAGEAGALEQRIAADRPLLANGLAKQGLMQQRRSLRLVPQNLEWRWSPGEQSGVDDLVLGFELPRGTFATAILRELIKYN